MHVHVCVCVCLCAGGIVQAVSHQRWHTLFLIVILKIISLVQAVN
jgi:hypothetical protein